MIKLIILDFDDTLSLTEEAFFNIENRIAEQMGFPPMSRAAHQKNWGTPVAKAIAQRIPGIDPVKFMEVHKRVMPKYIATGEVDTISEANIETLKKLKELGKRLAIVTSRSFNEAQHLLDENHHINRYIEKIYHLDNVKYHKPDPRVFDQALNDFAVTPQEAVYVGDSLIDGIGAKKANLHFIAILESEVRKKEDFKDIPVDFFATTFPEILQYIEKI